MQTRAYSICRRCAAVYPEGRRCPACDGDVEAGRAVHAATMHALEATQMARRRMLSGGALVVTSIVTATLLASLGMLALALF
jgi:hypothetical protein